MRKSSAADAALQLDCGDEVAEAAIGVDNQFGALAPCERDVPAPLDLHCIVKRMTPRLAWLYHVSPPLVDQPW